MRLTTQNIVATCDLKFVIPINSLNIEYSKKHKRFPSCIVIKRQEPPKYTLLLFQSGKCVITGVKTLKSIKVAIAHLNNQLAKQNIKSNCNSFIIRNHTASCNTNKKVSYEELCAIDNKDGFYDHEIFPGYQYSPKDSKLRAIIFHNGKIIITGGKLMKDMNAFFKLVIKKFNLV